MHFRRMAKLTNFFKETSKGYRDTRPQNIILIFEVSHHEAIYQEVQNKGLISDALSKASNIL